MADVAHQGHSYILNEDKLGSDREFSALVALEKGIPLTNRFRHSFVERSSKRPALYDQPLPKRNATTYCRHWA